jgi:hypothetical protein
VAAADRQAIKGKIGDPIRTTVVERKSGNHDHGYWAQSQRRPMCTKKVVAEAIIPPLQVAVKSAIAES